MTVDETSREYLDELSLQIGRAIISFTQLDHTITMVIKNIFGLTEVQERALVRPMSISNKCALLRLLNSQKVEKNHRAEVKAWIDSVMDVADQRNDLAHGFYGHKDGKAAVLSFSGKAKLKAKPKPLKPRDLGLLCMQIRHVRDEAIRLEPHFPKMK